MPTERASEERVQLIKSTEGLRDDIRLLSDNVTISHDQVHRLRIWQRVNSGVVAALLVVGGLAAYAVTQTHYEINCVRAWANATTQRSEILTKATTDKQEKLDAIIDSINVSGKLPTPQQRAASIQAIVDYQKAARAQAQAYAAHPVPKSPKFDC